MLARGYEASWGTSQAECAGRTVVQSIIRCDDVSRSNLSCLSFSALSLPFSGHRLYRCTLPYAFRFLCLRLHRGSLFLKDEP
jgi:hypothetical protein